ncbi:MAG: glycoside hydrolase family 65 protein [Oscillospiraceae bacterium]|nr:glycoside hydrolase family 65 protein [Oscillospiraceae bacterium]
MKKALLDFSRAKDWIVTETYFDPAALGKAEANFCLGNGYLGLRSATEERYPGETRDLLVAGTFDRFSPEEVTELPNAADVTNIELTLDGVRFDLTQGEILAYGRSLNIKTGLLTRDVRWKSPAGRIYMLRFERIVSLRRLHTIALRVTVTGEQNASVKLRSGIDGRQTCDGSQHFTEGQTRFYDRQYLQFAPRTIQSDIRFVLDASHRFTVDGEALTPKSDINIVRRRMFSNFSVELKAGQMLRMEKFANVFTSRDREAGGLTLPELQALALDALKEDEALGFDALAAESAACWEEKVWSRAPIEIDGPDYDLFAVRFAQYHMQLMTPAHDRRMNIGAKGLSGEGYKGHTFWDTEIFLLPYFIFSMPEVARSLEEYRYLSLPGAHAKARHNGFEGAQFPWESAWLDDGEVTPEYLGTDILTGQLIKVWSGFIEIHITADVAFGVWQYYMCTGDQDYMDRYGYELILDCAKFWLSRLEPGEDGLLHMNDVVGPDEYKEHVNDNAFTNYMARWNMQKAVEYSEELRREKPALYKALDEKLGLEELLPRWKEALPRVFLTTPNEQGVLPQDSTYLTLPDIDLTKYKKQAHVGGIYKDYNQEQIIRMQVTKQADVMVLFYLLEEQFSYAVKKASWDYYEPRTLHDSSLSLSTHSVLACDIGDTALGYEMYEKACGIDLSNDDLHSSDAGIHAASCGGLWQCVVYGFGGLRMIGGKLRVSPNLPEDWDRLAYRFFWRGQRIAVEVKKDSVTLVNETAAAPVELEIWGETHVFSDRLTVEKGKAASQI